MPSDYFDLNSLTGHQFENLIETLIQKMGFVTKERMQSADGGIDIFATYPQPILEGNYIIQCKRYSKPISVSVVRDLYGVIHSRNANKGILITNSTYTKPAIEFAENKQLELIDGEKLVQLLAKYDLLENYQIKTGDVLQLRNSWRIYNLLLIQPLNKLIKEMEDYKNGLVFINKKDVTLSRWYDIIDIQSKNLFNYMETMKNIFQQILPYLNTDEPKDTQIIQKYSNYVINSTKTFLNNYQEMYAINPSTEVMDLHKAFLNLYVAWFDDLTKFKTCFEGIMINPPKKGEKFEIYLGDEFNKAQAIWFQKRDKVKYIGPNLWWIPIITVIAFLIAIISGFFK
jgi:hypothetical protein